MFLQNYLSPIYLEMVIDNYGEYLNLLDEEHFKKIYELLKSYQINYIEDIILNYIEIFELDEEEVINGLNKLKIKLGDNYIYLIGRNLTYLNEIINNYEEKEMIGKVIEVFVTENMEEIGFKVLVNNEVITIVEKQNKYNCNIYREDLVKITKEDDKYEIELLDESR